MSRAALRVKEAPRSVAASLENGYDGRRKRPLWASLTMTAERPKEEARRVGGRSLPFRVGRYEVIERIGAGGMANVYLARAVGSMRDDGGFERLAAVKVLHPHLADDRGFVDMFLHEARVAANILHPNVVSILDVGMEDGLLYNVMDYVEGDTLAAVQSTATALGKGVPIPIALRIAIDVLSGLHAAHELRDERGEALGLVHRDVTPQNILIGVDGAARLTDFGVARARGRLVTTSLGMLKGKLSYMPPEQLEATELDRRADVFAMGVTLWETLTLRRLFTGRETYERARQNARAPYRPLSGFLKGVPPILDEICAKALAHDPADRYPTAAAFADAIEQSFGPTLATSREVGALIAAVAREKLERERAALRAAPRRAASVSDRPAPLVSTQGPKLPTVTEMLEASVLEPIPLVPQRRRASREAPEPVASPSRFFPKAPQRAVAPDESVTRELPLERKPGARPITAPPEAVAPLSIEVIDDRAMERVETALEPVRWTPLQGPPTESRRAGSRRRFSVAAWVVFVVVCVAIALARVLSA